MKTKIMRSIEAQLSERLKRMHSGTAGPLIVVAVTVVTIGGISVFAYSHKSATVQVPTLTQANKAAIIPLQPFYTKIAAQKRSVSDSAVLTTYEPEQTSDEPTPANDPSAVSTIQTANDNNVASPSTPITVSPAINYQLTSNPLKDYRYTGTVSLNDEVSALIENPRTREGRYLKLGDIFQGYKVTAITLSRLTLQRVEDTRTLVKNTGNSTEMVADAETTNQLTNYIQAVDEQKLIVMQLDGLALQQSMALGNAYTQTLDNANLSFMNADGNALINLDANTSAQLQAGVDQLIVEDGKMQIQILNEATNLGEIEILNNNSYY